MKKWIKAPQTFIDIFCQLPFSIHTIQKRRNYVQFAVGKDKNELDVVTEVSLIGLFYYHDSFTGI